MKFQSFKEIPNHLNQTCGFCNTPVNLVKLSEAFPSGDSGDIYSSSKEDYFSVLYGCPNCCRSNLIILGRRYTSFGSNYYYKTQFPKYSPKKMENIPAEIEADRFEAWKCYLQGCHKASAIMARASLQKAVRLLEANGGSLYKEIESLREKGTITKQLAEFAHEVRITGNDLAHPADAAEVNQNDIEESLDFLDGFLEVVFALPSIAERRKKDRDSSVSLTSEVK